MVSQITLGNFNTQNGRTVLTGGATGFDTEALIDGLVSAKRLPAVRLETANKVIDSKTAALTDLKTVFNKFKVASDNLRNPPGVDVASKNIFEYRTTSLVGLGGVTASNYLEVTAEPGAEAQSYTINSITQLAIATKQLTGDMALADSTSASAVTAAGSPVAGLFVEGTVNLRAVDGTVGGIAITLNQGDALSTVAEKFNEVSSRTGIQATVLNVSTGVYKMVFSATKTGTTYGFDLELTAPAVGAGIESDAAGVFSQITSTTVAGQTAQNAIFSIDGVSITRESNAVADVVDGVTFNLKDYNLGAGSILVNVKADTELAKSAITAFVDAYNEFRLFVSKQSELDEENQPKDTAVLYNNATFRTIADQISTEVSQIISGITSGPSQLSDIGLKLENFEGDDENLATKNILTIDQDALTSALQSDFAGVRKLFEYTQTSDNANFVTSKRSNSLNGVTGFTVVIDQVAGTYDVTYTDPVAGASTASFDGTAITGGVSLKGQVGTVFEGMEFVFASTSNATVTVTMTQGFGDRFYNVMESYLNTDDGLVATELESLTDTKTRNADEITQIDERMVTFRDKLIQQYAALEAALTKANQLLSLLDAQVNAANNA